MPRSPTRPHFRVVRDHPFTATYVAVAVAGWTVVGILRALGVL